MDLAVFGKPALFFFRVVYPIYHQVKPAIGPHPSMETVGTDVAPTL